MIPGSANPLLLATAVGAGGYSISRSLRFNSADSAYLSRTPASAGNRRTWTWAGWVKRTNLGGALYQVFIARSLDSNRTGFGIYEDKLYVFFNDTANWRGQGVAVLRDTAAWYHIVMTVDTTQATAGNRIKLWVNNQLATINTITGSIPSQNTDGGVNNTIGHGIGTDGGSLNYPLAGYLADIHFIDGQALDPTSFGEFDATTGVWMPKAYTGTYGTNGFHLDFADNSSNTATTLGKDTSGNSPANNWTPVNLSVASAPTSFSVQSVYAGWYRIKVNGVELVDGATNFSSRVTFSSGGAYPGFPVSRGFDGSSTTGFISELSNASVIYTHDVPITSLEIQPSNGASDPGVAYTVTFSNGRSSTILSPSGGNSTWGSSGTYYSFSPVDSAGNDSLVDVPTNGAQTDTGAGGEVRGNYCTLNPLDNGGTTISNGNLETTFASSSYATVRGTTAVSSGKWYWEAAVSAIGSTPSAVLVGVMNASSALNNYVGSSIGGYGYSGTGFKYNNGAFLSYGTSYTTNDVIGVALDLDSGTLTFYKNGASNGTAYSGILGQFFPAVSNYAGNVWILNFGQRPFAYTAPSGFKALNTANLPAPVVTNPSDVMDVALYTGNNTARSITGLGFSPDFVWIKGRSGATDHALYDIVRGVQKDLVSNSTAAETTQTTGLTAFNSDGFSIGTLAKLNTNAATYAAWAWDAGSSTVTNTQGSISSQVRANPSAGFSIVTYTGNGVSGSSVGHGLGVQPLLIITKNRSVTSDWFVTTTIIDGTHNALKLNTTAAQTASTQLAPTSTLFYRGSTSDVNSSGSNFVAYCFAPVAGYSAFGSYTGNGSADGPFVYLGFRPAFVLVKVSSTTGNWLILDNKRLGYNVDNESLFPNQSSAEDPGDLMDITSNGFKLRTISGSVNTNGATYIYAAFAESPFAANNRAR